MKNKILIIICSVVLLFGGCEVFVIKGRKIVIEENSAYTQTTPLGTVKIFVTELLNDNFHAATSLLIKDNGSFLKPDERHDLTTELARMKRFIERKEVKNETTTTHDVNSIVIIEFDNGSKARFTLIEKKSLYYIKEFLRE